MRNKDLWCAIAVEISIFPFLLLETGQKQQEYREEEKPVTFVTETQKTQNL